MKPNLKFHMNGWWLDATSCTFGTIVGIVLTVGITFWQQKGDREDMARKITRITLHNLDVRIEHVEGTTDLLAAKDSIYRNLWQHKETGFDKADPDSLLNDVNLLALTNYLLTDTKSEMIFSHSFEVWQYLEDEKVIGRISNCYTTVDFCEKLAGEWDSKISDALHHCQLKVIEKGIGNRPVEVVRLLMEHPETIAVFEGLPKVIYMLRNMSPIARQLNERNKQVLGLTEVELEEVGNLLERNSHSIDSPAKN